MSWDHAESFREKLRRGQVCLGTVISLLDPTVTEALGPLFDFFWIDMEHSVLSLAAVQAHVMATKGSDAAPLVPRALERSRADQAGAGPRRRGGDRAHGPHGRGRPPRRGRVSVSPGRNPRVRPAPPVSIRPPGRPEFCRDANVRVLPIVQVEHIEAVENIDEILAVPGLASIAFGPNDLAASMGLTGQPRHPDVFARHRLGHRTQPTGERPGRGQRRRGPRGPGGLGRAGRVLDRHGRRSQPHAPRGEPGGRPRPRADRSRSAGAVRRRGGGGPAGEGPAAGIARPE